MQDEVIDAIYNLFDDLFLDEKFCVANELLNYFNVSAMGTDAIIAVLSVTLPAKDMLFSREYFYYEAKYTLELRYFKEPGKAKRLLEGLE